MKKLIRITTVPISLDKLIEGQLAFMKAYYEVIAVSSRGKTLEKVGIKEGVKVVPIEMTRKITPFQDLKSVWELYQFLKNEKPQIVHTHTPKAGVVGMLASYLAKVPNRLHTVAGLPLLESKGVKRSVLNFVEKLTYSCATKVYPNSVGLKEIILKNNFVHESKLKVIANGSSNGIDTSYFTPEVFSIAEKQQLKRSLEIQKEDFVFIFVGRIVGDKGIHELIRAFSKLSKDNKQIKLLLVGSFEDELDPVHEKTKERINNNNQIISVGFQDDVRAYLAISNALVFPSYREGFPNVVMQAGAMGLPSIVSNINGCNEIIKEDINGVVIPVKSSEAIYTAMRKLIENKEYCRQLQDNARAIIVNNYEQKVVWQALLAEYKSLEKNV